MAGAALSFFIGYLFVGRETGGDTALISALFIILLAMPSFFALIRWMGPVRAATVLLLLGTLSICVEAGAILIGFPYGEFRYSEGLGYLLFGLVPWTVAFAYLPMLFGAVTLAYHLIGRTYAHLIPAAAFFTVVIDLVFDPAAIKTGFWAWLEPGAYYGVPIINYAGWAATGALYSFIFISIVRRSDLHPLPVTLMSSLFLIIPLWTGYLLSVRLWAPFLIGIALFAVMVRLVYRSSSSPDPKDRSAGQHRGG
jgi:bisanhydrobacterioruberin hydratase